MTLRLLELECIGSRAGGHSGVPCRTMCMRGDTVGVVSFTRRDRLKNVAFRCKKPCRVLNSTSRGVVYNDLLGGYYGSFGIARFCL